MSEKRGDLKSKALKPVHGTPFNQMTQVKKIMFVLRVVTCALTFGFVFTDVMND